MTPFYRSAIRVAIGVLVVLAIPFVAQLTGNADWSLFDFVFAGVMLAVIGATIELALARAGSFAVAAGIAALGILAVYLGEIDDSPGLMLLGLLLAISAGAMAVRSRRRAQ